MSEATSAATSTVGLDLPMASVNRAIKAAAMDNTIIAKDAKAAFSKAASVFILYLTATANELCKRDKRATITEKDVLKALEEIEFAEFVQPAKELVQAFKLEREARKKKATTPNAAEKEEEEGEGEGDREVEEEVEEEEEEEEVEEVDEVEDDDRDLKRARMD
jgi:DNA polymerase epsilon subunit 3